MSTLRLLALGATTAVLTLGAEAPASADPPVNTDGTGHVHHVWLGGGECLQLDSVTWDATDRGMHRGANSSTSARGPWHGPCPS